MSIAAAPTAPATACQIKVFTSIESGKHDVDDLWVDLRATDARFATDMTGFGSGQFGTRIGARYPRLGYLPKLVDLKEGYHIEVEVSSALVYEGRVADVDHGPGYLARGFTTEGYFPALDDDWQRSTATSPGLTTGQVLATFLRDRMPLFKPGVGAQWRDPNVYHARGMADFYKQTGTQLVHQIVQEGTNLGNQVAVQVWDGRTVWLLERTPPNTADYQVDYDDRILTWKTSKAGMVSSITVEYESITSGVAGLTVELPNEGFFEEHGFYRAGFIAAGKMTLEAATAVARRALAAGRHKKIQATIQVGRDPQTWVQAPGGILWPYYLVRAGRWIEVADQPKQPVLATNVDMAVGATYQVGALDPALGPNQNLDERRAALFQSRKMNLNGGRDR